MFPIQIFQANCYFKKKLYGLKNLSLFHLNLTVFTPCKIYSILYCICINMSTIIPSSFAAVSCGVPSAPVNGGVLAADYSVGTRVTYFCNGGYRLSSKELTTTVCQPDGTWSNHNKIPRCIGELCGAAALKGCVRTWRLFLVFPLYSFLQKMHAC